MQCYIELKNIMECDWRKALYRMCRADQCALGAGSRPAGLSYAQMMQHAGRGMGNLIEKRFAGRHQNPANSGIRGTLEETRWLP
jgi:hypothetical protein